MVMELKRNFQIKFGTAGTEQTFEQAARNWHEGKTERQQSPVSHELTLSLRQRCLYCFGIRVRNRLFTGTLTL